MTESDWNEYDNLTGLHGMLEWLCSNWTFSDRKARLFAVACCRRVSPRMGQEASRQAVEMAERFADGLITAAELDEAGDLAAAADMYRAALAAGGPAPETCFQLAEVLYRLGDLPAARERYYVALELDDNYVEARANLGCVLAELGQLELAAAAFEGTLRCHADYADVYYHLARTLDELSRQDDALTHWRRFLELAPDSPWSEEARDRLARTR